MKRREAKDPINVLFVNCDYTLISLKARLKDIGIRAQISQISLEEFQELFRNDQINTEVIIFHLTLGEDFSEASVTETGDYLRKIREDFPYVRMGVMSGAYDYDCLGKVGDVWDNLFRPIGVNFINGVVLELKPDFYCSYAEEDLFDIFTAEQIAKGWLKEEEIVWRNAEKSNILTPKTESGLRIRRERE